MVGSLRLKERRKAIMERNLATRRRVRHVKKIASKTLAMIVLVVFALITVIPFLFALSTSFTSPENIYDFSWIPSPIDVGNYAKFFAENNFWQAFGNTMLYIAPPILVGVFSSAMAAFALARIKFKGRNFVFYVLLATMVIPGVITMIPSYILFVNFYHWYGTPLPLIIPGMFGCASTMFFLHQYFKTLPKELEEAGEIDGMSKFGIFLKIFIPLSVPAILTQVVLSFNGCYNDYLGPLMYLGTSPNLFTVQLLVASLKTSQNSPYTLMMAASMSALLPTMILFIFTQKYFVEGIAMTGIKG
jgi:multiple sugar transport system permease protein